MMEKKGHVRIKEEKREDSSPFVPLSQYDDLAAKEVEDLRRTSDALSKELETMTAELSRLTEDLETGSSKESLSALYAEQTLHEKKIVEFQSEMPRLSKECASLRVALELSRIEEELNRISTQSEELRGKRESLSRELPVIESETAVCERFIEESETQFRDTLSAISEIDTQSKLLESKNESLKRLEELMHLVSTIEGVGRPGDDLLKDQANTYSLEIAVLQDELKKKDRRALAHALDIAGRLAQEYGHIGKEINELLSLLISKFTLMQGLEEKEQFVASLNTQIEELRDKVAIKTFTLDERRPLNSEDKKRVASLEDEINYFRKAVAHYTDEVAKGDEINRKQEAAVAEFVSLFIQKAELEAIALTVPSKIRALKDIIGEMV